MKTRKEIKRLARARLKKHYFIFVAACLMAALLASEFRSALGFVSAQMPGQTSPADIKTQVLDVAWDNVFQAISQDSLQAGQAVADSALASDLAQAEKGNPMFGRTRGVLSGVVNQITSGSLLVTLVSAAASVTGSESAGLAALILLAALGMAAFWMLVQNLFPVAVRRVFLEGLVYDRVTPQRFAFLLRVRCWLRAAWIMLVKYVFYTLWSLTGVGMVIKRYSYYLVPYIVAENPTLTARQAITLSRRMMQGHKWQCFVMELSFVGWDFLAGLTLGLSGLVYSNPYKIAFFSHYYAELRAEAIRRGLPEAKWLWDRYLYEKPSAGRIRQSYGDVLQVMESPEHDRRRLPGWRGFLADNLGILLLRRQQDWAFEQYLSQQVRVRSLVDDAQGLAYPVRLYPIPEEQRRSPTALNYMRRYSVWSLLGIFFCLSVLGWLWEVGMHLVSTGELVNRGFLHGPWLPIYGSGAVLILTLLHRLRARPALEFGATVVLCGFLEYMTSWVMELATGGTKWWDYSGYFLNLNGRICAEGLLVFGVGGLAIVYFIAPLLDTLFSRISEKKLAAACCLLLAVFLCDAAYSQYSPNTGRGVTDIETAAASQLPGSLPGGTSTHT